MSSTSCARDERRSSYSRQDREDGGRNESRTLVPDLEDSDVEIMNLQAKIEEKEKELVLKRKEIPGQNVEINTLRKRKEKDRLVSANAKKLASNKDRLC